MVQALANNLNMTNLEVVNNQPQESDTDFQLLLEDEISATAEETSETITEDIAETVENSIVKENETIVSELESEQLLSGILQVFIQPQTEENNAEQSDLELPQEDNLLSLSATEPQIENVEIETPAIEITPKETAKTEEGKTVDEIVDEETLKELNIESIEAEAAPKEGGGDLMQNQTPQEQGVKAIIQTDVEFKEIKPTEVQAAQKPAPTQEANPSKIIEQITKQMEGMKSGSRVNMVLNPESLGKVSIQLINTKEGLSAQFTVATQEARELIMKGLDGLKDTLLSHGVNVDNVSVKLSNTQESEYNSDWTEQENSEGGSKQQGSKKEEKNKEKFEQAMDFAQNENGEV